MLNIVKGLKSLYNKILKCQDLCQFTISRLVLLLSAPCGRGDARFEAVVMWVKEPFLLTDGPCAKDACKAPRESGIYLYLSVNML